MAATLWGATGQSALAEQANGLTSVGCTSEQTKEISAANYFLKAHYRSIIREACGEHPEDPTCDPEILIPGAARELSSPILFCADEDHSYKDSNNKKQELLALANFPEPGEEDEVEWLIDWGALPADTEMTFTFSSWYYAPTGSITIFPQGFVYDHSMHSDNG